MTAQLSVEFPDIVQQLLDEASETLQDSSLIRTMHSSTASTDLIPTELAQPAIFINSYVHFCVFKASIPSHSHVVLIMLINRNSGYKKLERPLPLPSY